VIINDLAVRAPDKRAVAKQLIAATEELLETLERQVKRDPSILDEKLADYVFFPLSNILRNQQEFPVRLTEITIRCIRVLVQHSWKNKIPTDLSQQLLIFLTYVIGGVPGKERTDPVPEETTLEALRAHTALVTATGASAAGAKSLVNDNNLPALGHTIMVILDTITKGETADIQFEALQALDSTLISIKDPNASATFLPGIVSSLSKLLTPPPAWKTPKKILVKGLLVLRSVLVSTLGDIKVTGLLRSTNQPKSSATADGQVLTASWLKATADQTRLALGGIMKLRRHKSEEVQIALERFCLGLLDECHQSLAVCAPILIETSMILLQEDDTKSLINAGLNTSLSDLTSIYPELIDTVKTTVYNWVTSLPRIMQSSDEEIKQQAIRNLLKGQCLMSTLRIDSSTLGNSLATSLRDSVAAFITTGQHPRGVSEQSSNEVELTNSSLSKVSSSHDFQPFLMDQPNQRTTRNELQTFISKSGNLWNQAKLAGDMLEYLRDSTGTAQVASFWLAFELVKAGLTQSSAFDEFLDFGPSNDVHEEALQELYTFSVSVLNSTEELEEVDWRLQSLALEVTTFAASRMKTDFRPELVDVLYPIATYLGSGIPELREHAIVTLNSIAVSCGYGNVADLVIENVDYMLNSVSLRLNTFDISPASTRVLRMMIRLTGPRLVPFLDDVVASIFGALDNYHGYTVLVENLFIVLVEIVNQGAKSDMLLLEDAAERKPDHLKQPPQMVSVEDTCEALNRRSLRKSKRREEDDGEKERYPERPWKKRKEEEDGDEDGEGSNQEVEKKPPPKTATYTLLTRITTLTQHYLTSPTPTLRKSLLDLLTVVCPALSPDEEAFLPVVNAIWPVLLDRLYDPEPFVVISACKALTALCGSAGDFLSTRVKTEWWDRLGKWCVKTKAADATQHARRDGRLGTKPACIQAPSKRVIGIGSTARDIVIPLRGLAQPAQPPSPGPGLDLHLVLQSGGGGGGLGRFTQAAKIWEAVQDLLVAMVSFVRIDDDLFEQILTLLGDTLADRADMRQALEVVNADAVWLALYEQGGVDTTTTVRPVVAGMEFVEV
jgi:TELO2-interacting protein 1